MSRILVQTAETAVAENFRAILTDMGHSVSFLSSDGEQGVAELVESIAAAAPGLAIMDYQTDDLLSVKVMQQSRDRVDFIKFVFLLHQEVGPEHLVLAVNEGASALLAAPVQEEALLNYVNRALTQRKEEKAQADQLAKCEQLLEGERNEEAAQNIGILAPQKNPTPYRPIDQPSAGHCQSGHEAQSAPGQ